MIAGTFGAERLRLRTKNRPILLEHTPSKRQKHLANQGTGQWRPEGRDREQLGVLGVFRERVGGHNEVRRVGEAILDLNRGRKKEPIPMLHRVLAIFPRTPSAQNPAQDPRRGAFPSILRFDARRDPPHSDSHRLPRAGAE